MWKSLERILCRLQSHISQAILDSHCKHIRIVSSSPRSLCSKIEDASGDSTPYSERYTIPEAKTVIRGTMRYQGFSAFVRVLVDLGFLSEEKHDFLTKAIPWSEATQKIIGSSSGSESDLRLAIESKTKFNDDSEKDHILAGLRWIGLFSDKETTQPKGTPLDTLCATLEQKMQYDEGQRDMVLLQHKFEIEHKDGAKETRTSTLCEYGEPGGYSAMARLVGGKLGFPALCGIQADKAF